MKPGPKPKPTARKRLEGTVRPDRLNPAEPTPPAASEAFEAVPAELVGHAAATAEWTRLAPMLRSLRVITELDRAALLSLCLEWSRYLTATTEVARTGMVIAAPSGYPVVNPYVGIAARALGGCLKLWPELGLTPSSRTRVSASAYDADDDPFAEFDDPAARRPS